LNDDSIVVTGIGAVSPLGIGAARVWSSFVARRSGIVDRTELDPERDKLFPPPERAGRAGYVRGFEPRELIRSPQLRRMDWCSRMAAAAARLAMADAGLLPLTHERSEDSAIVVGSCYGNQRETEQFLDRVFASGGSGAPPFIFPNLVLNAPAAYAAIELDVQGPNLTVSEHEASGEAALVAAIDLLRGGAASRVCAGGVDEFGSVYLEALRDRRILHPDSLPRDERGRAHAHARGVRGNVVPGEGSAMLVIERGASARARGARIYADIECARIGGTPAGTYGFARDVDVAAETLLGLVAGEDKVIDGVIGGADGSAARDALDRAVLRAIAVRQTEPVTYAPFRRLTGEWGAVGALGVALAALALDAGHLPALPLGEEPLAGSTGPKRILVVGTARSGVLAPVLLQRP
jgi:3-oxoacyl-[acyl-carrier-protein] synthase II